MRAWIAHTLYLLLIDAVAVFLITEPANALLSSSTGYVRVAQMADSVLPYIAANRASIIGTASGAIASGSAASVAVRAVAGPTGWASLAVQAGLVIAAAYYSQSAVTAIKSATTGDGSYWNGAGAKIAGSGQSSGFTMTQDSCTGTNCAPGTQTMTMPDPNAYPYCGYYWVAPVVPGWTVTVGVKPGITPTTGCTTCCQYTATSTGATPQQMMWPGYTGAAPQSYVNNYLSNLPPSSPYTPENATVPVGQTGTSPQADSTTDVAVTPQQIPSVVKPIQQVASNDAVLDPNAPASSTTTTTTNNTQNTTNTTNTTTTTANGTTTTNTTQSDSASVSCTSGTHDTRTLGSILQAHMTTWQASGLVGALNNLKTMTWPSTLPTYTLQSSIMGTFSFDFNAWGNTLLALRTLIIAMASFVAYRIIFVGNK